MKMLDVFRELKFEYDGEDVTKAVFIKEGRSGTPYWNVVHKCPHPALAQPYDRKIAQIDAEGQLSEISVEYGVDGAE